MKVSKVAAVAVIAIASNLAHAEASLTLDQAIRLAMTRNERAAIAKLDVTIAEAELANARTAFLPVVDASGNAAYRPRADPELSAEAAVALTQPIFAPSAFPLHSQAKHLLAGQRARSAEDHRRLAFDTANAFVAVLLADQVMQAAQRKLETATVNLQQTDAQVQAQLVSSNDVTRAKISLASANRELAASKGNLDAAYLDLELLINQKVASVTAPASLLVAGQAEIKTSDDLIAQSIGRRADLMASKELARAARDFAREPRMRYLPAFELGAQLSAATGDGDTFDALIAVSARWTLWDSGGRAAETRARDARARIADLETAQLARSIENEVRAAAALLSSRQLALVAAGDARDAARKGATEASILYKQGLAKAIELVDANDQRFIAEVNHATSEFDVARAYLALRLAMGLEPLEVTP